MREIAPTGTRRISPHLALVLAFAIGLGAPAGGLAATVEEIRELVRQATSDPDIQRELPLADPDGAGSAESSAADRRAAPSRYGAAGRTETREDSASVPDQELRFELTLNDEETLFAVLGVLAIAGLVWAALRFLPARRARDPEPGRDRSSDTTGEDTGPEPPGAEAGPARLTPPGLDEADRLARDGAYGEAVGVILRHAIERLRGAHQLNLPPSLTSREVRQRIRLDEAPGAVLDRLVAVTERSRFGGCPASESDFRACRERFLHHLAREGGSTPG